jgi:hypothetical protein
MKIIKIKNLKKLVEEVSSDYMEMAYKPKGVQKPKIDPETGKEIIPKSKGFWKDDNNTEVPDYWVLNPTQEEGKDKLIVPLDCSVLENFIEENRDWLNSIGASHSLDPTLVACKRTKYHPRNIKVGTSYQWSGINMSATERLKRMLHDLVEKYLGSGQISARLEKCSIPEIKSRDRKHLNRYGKMTNEVIEYATHTFNSYLSSKQFLQFVTARITGKPLPPEFKSYHLARQFNEIYRNWAETKKNDSQYVGQTDAYMLDKFGFDPDNLDVTVRTDFSIKGKNDLTNKTFTWVVTLDTKFGRKLKEDPSISSRKLTPDINIVIEKTAQYTLEENETFNDERTVLDKFEIKQPLIEALSELGEKIMTDIKPVQALKLANVLNYDITKKKEVE